MSRPPMMLEAMLCVNIGSSGEDRRASISKQTRLRLHLADPRLRYAHCQSAPESQHNQVQAGVEGRHTQPLRQK